VVKSAGVDIDADGPARDGARLLWWLRGERGRDGRVWLRLAGLRGERAREGVYTAAPPPRLSSLSGGCTHAGRLPCLAG
jgi:hypothetical protein